jgi:UDP-N-acetyl-D-glucosamine dehydrogenase
VGGHCLPIDPSYLSWRVRRSLGHTFRFVELANDVNDHMPDYVVRRLMIALNQRGLAVRGQKILLLGMAYKRNTGDARESPSQPIVRELLQLGADVRVADPFVDDRHIPAGVTRVDATPDVIAEAAAVLFLVSHDAFDVEALATHATYVFDTQHHVPPGPNVEYL